MECIFPAVVFIITSMVTQAGACQRMIHAENLVTQMSFLWVAFWHFVTDHIFTIVLRMRVEVELGVWRNEEHDYKRQIVLEDMKMCLLVKVVVVHEKGEGEG